MSENKEAKYYAIKGDLERNHGQQGASKFNDTELKVFFGADKDVIDRLRKDWPRPTKEAAKMFSRIGQAEEFIRIQPLFYDRAGSFWKWNFKLFRWERVDDVDVLNMVQDNIAADTINSKERTEILNALQQVGRKNVPKEIKKTWVQFKDKIYDVKTGESINASPEYFVTNPIMREVSHNPKTPTIDNLFAEWVGEEYVETLHEIISYCILPDYPIHRLFCFVGAGMNGKSCFLRLLREFIGNHNVTSTELDLLLSSRFEVTKLYKKLVCQMGETNFSEMSKTSILKKLTGGDTIGFEYKRKDQFDDVNYAKIIIATNNLPTTSDKTIGFYRRWLIIDFPNQFSEDNGDPLDKIPEEEWDNLAARSLVSLNRLLENRQFHNEGNVEERIKRFEDRSNPLEKFLREFTKEDPDGHIFKFEFERRLNEWCKENRFRQISRVALGKKMKEIGIDQGLQTADWIESPSGNNKRLPSFRGISWINDGLDRDDRVNPT